MIQMQKKVKKISKFVNQPLDFILCAIVFILMALGIVMVLSASAPSALAEGGEPYEYAGRQLLFGILGIIAMFFISFLLLNSSPSILICYIK